jgi:DNA-directed RNA polymerase specialized sigma24 family protein
MTTMLEEGTARSTREADRRENVETLLRRADGLPPGPQALVFAYFDRGMSVREIAAMNGLTPRAVRFRLDRLRAALADPCFLLAVRYGETLPRNLRPLVRAYWFEGHTMRDLATAQHTSLHRIRQQVGVAKSMLLMALSSENARAKARAHEALCDGLKPQRH